MLVSSAQLPSFVCFWLLTGSVWRRSSAAFFDATNTVSWPLAVFSHGMRKDIIYWESGAVGVPPFSLACPAPKR